MSDARARILARIEAAAAGRPAARTPGAGDPVQPALRGDLLDSFETAAVAADTEVVRLHGIDDVPDAVVIDEAVGLARGLSTDESPAFVNGVLARILDLRPRLAV